MSPRGLKETSTQLIDATSLFDFGRAYSAPKDVRAGAGCDRKA